MSAEFKLNRVCPTCGIRVSDTNKSGSCNRHRDRTGTNNPFYGKRHSKETIEAMTEKTRAATIKKWEDPEYRNKVIEGTSKPRRISFKKEQSARITKWYEDNPEQREIRSKRMKRSWEEVSIIPGASTSSNSSKIEKELFSYLQSIFGTDVKKISIKFENGKWLIPDAICLGYDIIELYGDYWHANPSKYVSTDIIHHGISASRIWESDRSRELLLKEYGFRVSIVWESDFRRSKEKSLSHIITMIDWESCSL